jgi:ABC-type nickel/cobalt efflux system permease component RcnA
MIPSSGVLPCPDAALILIFCLSQHLPWIGVLAALAMCTVIATATVGIAVMAHSKVVP